MIPLALIGLLAGTLPAMAQTPPEPPLQMQPVVTVGGSLAPAGTTRVELDGTMPASLPSLDDLAARVAGFHVNAGGAGAFGDVFTLRGLANTPFFSDPSVTLYYDDLPLGSSFTYPTGLFGFASAVVSRGPQGTAFGRGGAGGVVALLSAEPGATPGGEARVSFGAHQARSAAFTARSARDPRFDATVAAAYAAREGYVENTRLGATVDDQETSTLSARLRWRSAAAHEFTLQLLGGHRRDGAQPLVPLAGPLHAVARDRDGAVAIDFGGVALKAAFATALGRLTATTSYTDWRLHPYTGRLVLPPALDSLLTQAQRAWNEEVRLTSSPGHRWHWHVGAWFSDSKTSGQADRAIPGLFPIEASGFTLDARTLAWFGGADFSPADHWRVSLGVRAENTRKAFSRDQTVPSPGHFADRRTFSAWTPKLSVSHALSPRTNVSAGISTGTKPGGWSAYTADAAQAPFQAEKVTALEAGFDLTLADKTVTLAARWFGYAIRDYQIERSFNASDYLVVNAPRARSLGAELEGAWHPAPDWTLAATLGVTKTTLREFTDPFTGASYAGNRAPYAPAYDAQLSLAWRPERGWFARAEAVAAGRTYFDESENIDLASQAHTLLNARAGYDGGRWIVSLYGLNLAGKGYYALVVPGVRHAVPGAPRAYGLEATWKL